MWCMGEVKLSSIFGNYSRTPTHRVWLSMIARCESKSCGSYERYGAIGISVCERWRSSYVNFYEDMGEKPGNDYQIDRIKNEKGYEPGNCRWVTKKENARNKRNNHLIEYDGQTRCLAEWCELKNIAAHTIQNRMKLGWSFAKAIETPAKRINRVSTSNPKGTPAWVGVVKFLLNSKDCNSFCKYDESSSKEISSILGWAYQPEVTAHCLIKALGKSPGKLKKSYITLNSHRMVSFSLPDVLTV